MIGGPQPSGLRSSGAAARLAWLLILATVFALASAAPAVAACAAPPALADAVDGAASVFIGEVVEASFGSEEATLSVLWIWKGPDLSAELTVATPAEANGSEPGFRFREGSTFIVIVDERTSPIVIGECSGTRVYRGDGEAIPADLQDAAGRSTGRLPGELVQDDEPDPMREERTRAVWLGILAALGMILVAVMAYQSRGEDAESGTKRVRGVFSRGRSGDRQLGKIRRRRRR